LDLPVAGIDLRCTPSAEWYCFEVNPAPGFSYYQQATGQPISSAIAILLAGGGNYTSVEADFHKTYA
jgi:D-alanine-D-alanine ligase-like ATP-grasp enzyme